MSLECSQCSGPKQSVDRAPMRNVLAQRMTPSKGENQAATGRHAKPWLRAIQTKP